MMEGRVLRSLFRAFLATGLGAVACLHAAADAPPLVAQGGPAPFDRPTLAQAQHLFYNARYDEAAALSLAWRSAEPENLAAYEIRTSALLFQLKRALDDHPDKEKAFKQCVTCPGLMTAFMSDTTQGQALARARVRQNPADDEALFFLGKLNLNYVWLQLGTLGRKTGWDQYWEARKSLDAALKRNPRHVRARVSRAWIDYIVDTKLPRGTRWLLGGGSRKRALAAVREAADAEADFFSHAEAEFALWDLLVRERNLAEAATVAQELACDFPENRELAHFLDANDPALRRGLDAGDGSLCDGVRVTQR
jgi:hypothetical protein